MVRISVCVPLYNAEKYIKQTLDSIINQSVKPYEIIVLNDCSTDESVSIVEEYKDVLLFHNEKNMGIGYTRQRLIDLSEGYLVAFLSSDDVYHKDFLKKSSKKLFRGVGTYTDYYRCNSELIPFDIFRCPEYSLNNVIDYASNKNMFINFSSIIFDRDVDAKFIPNLKHGEDIIFLLDMIISGYSMFNRIPEPLVYYRIHDRQGTYIKEPREDYFVCMYLVDRLMKLGLDKDFLFKRFDDILSYRRYDIKIRALKKIKDRLL